MKYEENTFLICDPPSLLFNGSLVSPQR